MDSAEECFRIRQQLREDRAVVFGFDDVFADGVEAEPESAGFSGSSNGFVLVGHGSVANEYCGRHMKTKACLNVDAHDFTALDGVNHRGQVYYRVFQHFCNSPSCPVCYRHGWAVRLARKIEARLKEASKRFGQVEHLVCSVPVHDYGLSYEDLRNKVEAVLSGLGVVGGVLVFHGFRFNRRRGWYWSPHCHALCFILGGYGKCRYCKRKNDCLKGCGGFDDRQFWESYKKNGYYVKVFPERITVFGTAVYELNHACVKVSVKRFHPAVYFGVCGCRKMKVTPEKREEFCPLCQEELEDAVYCGSRHITDVRSPSFRHKGFADLEEDGFVVWIRKGNGG